MSYLPQRDIRKANGWVNTRELAHALGIGQHTAEALRQLFPPAVKLGHNRAWTGEQVEQIKRHLESRKEHATVQREVLQTAGYWSVKSAARKCGVPHPTWNRALEEGRIPRPTHRIGAYRFYTETEAQDIAKYFEANKRPDGCLTGVEAAELLGVCRRTVYAYCQRHGIGTATRTHRWLSDTDIKRLAKLMGAM